MEIKKVTEVLNPVGLNGPTLNALTPNTNNYEVLLLQPQGDLVAL